MAKRFKSNNQEFRKVIARFLLGGIPEELVGTKVKNDIDKFQALFDGLGCRTTIVKSPRKAMSVYLDSCDCIDDESPKAFLTTMIGMNPLQSDLETLFAKQVRDIWCLLLFCKRIEEACNAAIRDNPGGNDLLKMLEETMGSCKSFMYNENINHLPFDQRERTIEIRRMATAVDHRVRLGQLERELDRVQAYNSTLSNSMAHMLFDFHATDVKDVVFKQSHQPQFQRISFYLYDQDIDEFKPPTFVFVPCLSMLLRKGYQEIVCRMVDEFWEEMLKRGYFASASTRLAVEPNLKQYIESGLTSNPNSPFLVLVLVSRSYQRSAVSNGDLHDAGKSSLVRLFGPALNAVIIQYVDPAILVRFVKQNLNKSQETLRLELDLRPNNNDMSVMSIIQSRRMTLGQSKPGLVLVGFEEMPSCGPNRDPDQLTTCQLISQRFAGRKGEYEDGIVAPTNSAKRGISGDATIVPMFTSNYLLEEASANALRKLEMFQQLCVVPIEAISGQDRANFASHYVSHCLVEKAWTEDETASIDLNVDVGEGDTRPLVRQLRMIAFYLNRFKLMQPNMSKVVVSHGHAGDGYIIQGDRTTTAMELKKCETGNLYATRDSSCMDHELATSITNQLKFLARKDELSTILSFWIENALAPAVIVTQNESLHKALVAALLLEQAANTGNSKVKVISSVDASQYKMMKSLYDDSETTRNLKDDIVALGGGKGGNDPLIVVDLVCPTLDSQLCIREMIEDTPSQTAFSSEKSALYKNGILFVVMIPGEMTPEVRSRASLVL